LEAIAAIHFDVVDDGLSMSESREMPISEQNETGETSPAPPPLAPAGDDGDIFAEAVAVPARYWWLKRIVLASIVIPAVLFGLQRWWDHDAERRLQVEIDRIVAAGEPIYPQDFDPKEVVPKADNAVLIYKDAAGSLTLTWPDRGFLSELIEGAKDVGANLPRLRGLVAIDQRSLDLVRQARSRNRAEWGARMRTPMLNYLLPAFGDHRSLARLVIATSLLRFEDGDSRTAFALLQDAIAHAEAIDAHPSLIGHLVAIAEYNLTWRTIETILPGLEISGGATSEVQAAIPRSLVTDLIEQLRNEEALQAAHVLATQTERAMILDLISGVADGRISLWAITGGGAPPWVLRFGIPAARPILNEDAMFVLSRRNKTVLSVRQSTWPKATAMLPVPPNGLDAWLHPLSHAFEPSFDRAILLHYRAVAMRRMARIALAMRLYELDHGERPLSLESLVPEYLPALPVDPFSDGQQTFGYLRDDVRPRIYSINTNGIDDDGYVTFREEGKLDFDKFDIPFFLNGARPRNIDELNSPVNLLSPSD
jgi:hypothetical protein